MTKKSNIGNQKKGGGLNTTKKVSRQRTAVFKGFVDF